MIPGLHPAVEVPTYLPNTPRFREPLEKGVLGHFGERQISQKGRKLRAVVRFQAGSINLRRAVRGEVSFCPVRRTLGSTLTFTFMYFCLYF